jgi:hypothetical protein
MAGVLRSTAQPEEPHNTTAVLSANAVYHTSPPRAEYFRPPFEVRTSDMLLAFGIAFDVAFVAPASRRLF